MARRKDSQLFKRNSKVVAAIDLPDIPEGTPGKVMTVNGLTWIRYHVLFENGVERSSIHNEWLSSVDDYEKRKNEAERAAYRAQRQAERQAALVASGTAAEF